MTAAATMPVTRRPRQDLPALLQDLARPEAYPHPVRSVEVVQTHISVVFLAGDRAYKVKKELNLGFLDYSTLERRRACCRAEVALNRRLAPDIYLGVAAITRGADGRHYVQRRGQVVDYAVVMKRLPEERTFSALLDRGSLGPAALRRTGRLLAHFHGAAARSEQISAYGKFDVVARNCRENFDQLRPYIGTTISPAVFARLLALTEQELQLRRPLIEVRARIGRPCDTHGDLRLEHLYLLKRRPPRDLIAVDCIEFNRRFRYADPVADLAFLVMDLLGRGRRDLTRQLVDAYRQVSRDLACRALLPLYTAYRATVRGKVDSFLQAEDEVPQTVRWKARSKARGRFLLALGQLAPPRERPSLVLVTGPTASGKSTLAHWLAEEAGYVWVRSDAIRKELAGLSPQRSARARVGGGIYTPDWTDWTYQTCLEKAEKALFHGRRVVVDASFVEEARRRPFLEAARRWQVPSLVLTCQVAPEEARRRLAARRDRVSDAHDGVLEHQLRRWEPPTEGLVLDTGRPLKQVLGQVAQSLRDEGLLG